MKIFVVVYKALVNMGEILKQAGCGYENGKSKQFYKGFIINKSKNKATYLCLIFQL